MKTMEFNYMIEVIRIDLTKDELAYIRRGETHIVKLTTENFDFLKKFFGESMTMRSGRLISNVFEYLFAEKLVTLE